ncbi:MAG TPA: HAD family hydrolase [archaeon]|nr:HAD family hydrolase [archaeon]
MPKKLLLDFDGTLTDTSKEAQPALEKWDELFSERTGMPLSEVKNQIKRIKFEILSNPKTGWTVNGYVMAPAAADPYVLHTTAYQALISKGGIDENILTEIFHDSYPFSATIFREGAADFLDALLKMLSVVIVTNSRTEPVEGKLRKLGNYSIPIMGNAKKYVPDPAAAFLPKYVHLEGFPRPVVLARRHYKEILDGFNPEETAVMGDIYELDLALPEFLGFSVVQIATPNTPSYEIQHHRGRPRNFFATSYSDALKHLEK